VALTTKVNNLEDQLTAANQKIDELELYNRRDNLIISGLPMQNAAEAVTTATPENRSRNAEHSSCTENSVTELFNRHLNVPIVATDVSIAHRLKQNRATEGPPAVIVRFTNRKARDAVYAARRKLKNLRESRVFINEDLSKPTVNLFMHVSKLAKEKVIHSTWTSAGEVFYKLSSDTLSRPIRVQSSSELPVLPCSD